MNRYWTIFIVLFIVVILVGVAVAQTKTKKNSGLAKPEMEYFNDALKSLESGDLEQAEILLTKAILSKSLPEKELSQAYSNRGAICCKYGKTNEGISDYNLAIKINPNDIISFLGRANCYGMNNQFDMAISDYDKAISLKPDYAKAYAGRGLVYQNMGQIDKASQDISKACDLGYMPACFHPLTKSSGKTKVYRDDENKAP